MKKWLACCLAAFRFLTIFPVPGKLGTKSEDLAGATPYFPLVGCVLGGLAALGGWGLCLLLPRLPAVSLTVLLLFAFSGALHLDGLADTADGFFSSRPREQILAIMRDSRTGAMGVVALVMVLLLKVSALFALNLREFVTAVFLMPLVGRTGIVLLMAALPYARSSGGLASLFYSRGVRLAALWSVLLLFYCTFLAAGIRGGVCVFSTLIVIGLFGWFCHEKIGGATGDTLGAGCEVAETVLAIAFCFHQ